MWHHVGHCPKGTVPIRRSSVEDVMRARSLYHYGKKQRRLPLARDVDAPDVVSGNGHEVSLRCDRMNTCRRRRSPPRRPSPAWVQ